MEGADEFKLVALRILNWKENLLTLTMQSSLVVLHATNQQVSDKLQINRLHFS